MTKPPSIASLPVRIGIRLLALRYLDDAESARERLKHGRDEEALHDFRVALRRLRSCLRAYRPYFADTVRGRDRRAVRELAAATGRARDLEVQLAWLEAQGDLPPDVAAGRGLLTARLREARGPADREALGAVHRFPALREAIEPKLSRYCESFDRRNPLRTIASAAAAADLAIPAIDELDAALGAVGSAEDGSAIHEARIAGKRIRYLFEPYAGETEGGTGLVKRLRKFQDDLGEMHDFDVLLGRIREEASRSGPEREAAAALAALDAYVGEARRGAFAKVEASWLGGGRTRLLQRARAFAGALRPASTGERESVEIERKYLLRSMPRLPETAVMLRIDQGYLPGERLIERVRRVQGPEDTKYYRTVKLGSGVRRIEVEEETDAGTFRALWRLTKGRRIAKRRYVIPDGDRKWEIDRFIGRRLVLAEIELVHEAADVQPPPWLERRLVREVTDEPEYQNVNLAG